jgi:hypothetical protein
VSTKSGCQRRDRSTVSTKTGANEDNSVNEAMSTEALGAGGLGDTLGVLDEKIFEAAAEIE